MNNKEILTIDEAAEYLQLGKISIYNLIKTKKIPHGAPRINPRDI